jgi:hypothetical protein
MGVGVSVGVGVGARGRAREVGVGQPATCGPDFSRAARHDPTKEGEHVGSD